MHPIIKALSEPGLSPAARALAFAVADADGPCHVQKAGAAVGIPIGLAEDAGRELWVAGHLSSRKYDPSSMELGESPFVETVKTAIAPQAPVKKAVAKKAPVKKAVAK